MSRPRSGACGSARPCGHARRRVRPHVAEWMVRGEPSIDMAEADANRFYPYMTTPPFVLERGKQQYREVYDIIHPRQQMARPQAAAVAVLRPPCGSRRGVRRRRRGSVPSGSRPTRRSIPSDAPGCERDEWARGSGRRSRAPSTWPRAAAALFDLTAFAKFDVEGPTRSRTSSGVREPDRPSGRDDRLHGHAHATAGSAATSRSRARSDELFRVITGGGSGQHDLAWMRRQVGHGERVRSPSAPGRCSRSACGGRTRARSSRRSPTWTWATTRSRT